jgi:hypothetical protein
MLQQNKDIGKTGVHHAVGLREDVAVEHGVVEQAVAAAGDLGAVPRLKMTSSPPPSEEDQVVSACSSTVETLLKLQALLGKFQCPQVRADFLSGKLVHLEDPELTLLSLDAMRNIFSPGWSPSSAAFSLAAGNAFTHITQLMKSSRGDFIIPCGNVVMDEGSYVSWKTLFDEIMHCSYWLTLRENESENKKKQSSRPLRCSSPSQGNCGSPRKLSKKMDPVSPSYRRTELPRRSVKIEHPVRSSRHRVDLSNRYQQLAEVELSDSSCESIYDSRSSNSDYDSSSNRNYHRGYVHPKKVVTPKSFDMMGRQSLKQFLDKYERYFKAEFRGDQRDCTQELSKFISGDLLDAYDALGGAERKYNDMKIELLRWYKTQMLGGTRRWKQDLSQCSLKPGDSLKLFGMRLQEIAQRAYPNDERECVKQLLKKFVNSAPAWFSDKIDKREEVKEMIGQGKKLTWAEMLALAEREDRRILKDKMRGDRRTHVAESASVFYTHGIPEAHLVQDRASPERQRVFINSSMGKENKSMVNPTSFRNNKPPQCEWCGKFGHWEGDCWRKNGACLICGSKGHKVTECPRYEPPQVTSNRTCPRCRGNHWGKDCPRNVNLN